MRSTAWPLVGRDDELALLVRALADGGAVVAGAAGVGKSRLAGEAALAVAAAAGSGAVSVPRTVGRPSAIDIPLAPFAPLLAGSGVVVPLDAASEIAAGLAARWSATGAEGAPVLIVDDAHWFDPASATVLHQLVAEQGVRVLATLRTGSTPPPEVVQLWSDELVARVDVAPLDDARMRELLVAVLDAAIEETTVQTLVRVSAGNVLYLRELTLGSIEAGLLVRHLGVWRFTGSLSATPRLVEIVDARLAALDEPARHALELVAVAGSLAIDDAERLVPTGALEPLQRAGLLDVRPSSVGTSSVGSSSVGSSSVVELAHPLHAEVLRSNLGELAHRRIARSLAEQVHATDDWTALRPDQRMQLALWHLDGGLPIAADRLLAAADEAVSSCDQVLGARLASAAFDADHSAGSVILASWCRAELGQRDEAERLLLAAVDPDGVPRDQAAIHIRLAEDRYWGRDDPEGAAAILDGFLASAAGRDPDARALVEAYRPVLTLLSGDVRAAVAATEPWASSEDVLVRLQAAVPRNIGLAHLGRCRAAADQAGAALAEAMDREHPYLVNPGPHIVGMGWALLNSGDVAGARGIAELVYAEAARRPGFTDRGWAAAVMGIVKLEEGRLRDAVRYLVESEAMWRAAGVHTFARVVAGMHALALAQLGDGAGARAALAPDAPTGTMRFMDGYVLRAESWIDWLEGRREPAIRRLVAGIAECREQGAVVLAAAAAHDLARLGRADLACASLVGLGDLAEAGLAQRFVEHAAGLAGDDLDDLDRLGAVVDDFEAAGQLLVAAETATEVARRSRRRGRARDADRFGARAAAMLVELGPVATPMLGVSVGSTATRGAGGLSRREQEVADLAARGLSNRAIAETLVLSERTIENHLYRAFAKLGITSRDALPGSAGAGRASGQR